MTCPYNVTDAVNCTCVVPYTTSSDFSETNNCAEVKGVNLATACFDLGFYLFTMFVAAVAIRLTSTAIRSSNPDGSRSSPKVVRANMIALWTNWIPLLAFLVLSFIVAAIAAALPRSNAGYKFIFALAFFLQLELDLEFSERTFGMSRRAAIAFRVIAGVFTLYAIIMAFLSVGSTLVVMTPLACALLVTTIAVLASTASWQISARLSEISSNIFSMLWYLLWFRLAVLIATIANLAYIPSSNGASTVVANVSWSGAAMIFTVVAFTRLLLLLDKA